MPVSCSCAAFASVVMLHRSAACAFMLLKGSVASLPARWQHSLLKSVILPVSTSSIQAALYTFPGVCIVLCTPPAEQMITSQIACSPRCLGSDYLQHTAGNEQEQLGHSPQHIMYAASIEKGI